MPFEIVYDKENGQVIAARSMAAPKEDLNLVEGQDKLFLDFDFSEQPPSAFRVDSETGTLVQREDWVEPEPATALSVQADAPDFSPIDGIPELPADGESSITITVQKISLHTGNPLTGARHTNLLNIRTTAGTLSARQTSLSQGKANFSLRSSTETVVAEVKVWAKAIPKPAILRVEFAPAE